MKKEILVGNRIFMAENQIEIHQEIEEKLKSLEDEGKTAILVAGDKKNFGNYWLG